MAGSGGFSEVCLQKRASRCIWWQVEATALGEVKKHRRSERARPSQERGDFGSAVALLFFCFGGGELGCGKGRVPVVWLGEFRFRSPVSFVTRGGRNTGALKALHRDTESRGFLPCLSSCALSFECLFVWCKYLSGDLFR